MADRNEYAVPAYLGRVLDDGGAPVGTCFQVAPGIAVTARHVCVEALAANTLHTEGTAGLAGATLRVDGLGLHGELEAAAEVVAEDGDLDLAVLCVSRPLPGAVTLFAPSGTLSKGTTVEVTGHGVLPGDDRFRSHNALGSWVGDVQRHDGALIAQITSKDVLKGMSGAPVLRVADHAVVGVVTSRYRAADEWGLNTVWVARTEDLPALLHGRADISLTAVSPPIPSVRTPGRRGRWLAAALTLAMAAVVGAWAVMSARSDPPSPMASDFNVAVAGFTLEGQRIDLAGIFRDDLSGRLKADYPALRSEVVTVELSPRDVADETVLSEVARRVNAHIVISAEPRSEAGDTVVSLRVFMTSYFLRDAPEVAGTQTIIDVRVPGQIPLGPVAASQLRAQLLASASAVAELLPAFDYYQLSQLDAAYAAFARAARSPLNDGIRAMAHLMMGNIENRRHKYSEAEQNYQLALEDRPGFVRARLGLAQVAYQRATGGCDGSGLDAKGLAVSERDYAAVLNDPESSEVTRARATFGLGQIHSCRSQALLHDEWAQARTTFRSVISLHTDQGNLLTRGLASEAYAGLALADSPSEGGPAQTDASRRAAEEYLQAATLALDPARAALFRRLRAHLNQRLGNYAEACADLSTAKALAPAVTAPSISATCPIPKTALVS